MIDTALLRPGRFDKIILVPLPDKEGRKKILEINAKDIPVVREPMVDGVKNPDYVDLDKIAESSDGMSGADVASIANTAVSLVIHEFLAKYPDQKEAEKQAADAKVTMRHFEEAVRKVRTQKELKIGEKVAVPYYR